MIIPFLKIPKKINADTSSTMGKSGL